jgi:ribosomal protein L7/L12
MNFQDYIQVYDDYFWQWEDGGEVLSIRNGNTIAYRKYVTEVLENLNLQGLPPFGSLLLAIIATNPNAKADLDNIDDLLIHSKFSKNDINPTLTGGIDFLYGLSELPNQYKANEKRLLLFQAIFKDCHNINSIKNSKTIINRIKTMTASSLFENATVNHKSFSESNFYRDFRTLALLNNKFPTTKSILDAIAGLPTIDEPIPIFEEESDNNSEKYWLDELYDNPKGFHTSALIKHIWGGLNIPFHSILPSQQPLGGFSDLTNKGDFDRLLISEFANDDLLFLSRLANNEALYINREIPPQSNDLERIVLIDISIKNWGTPRTIAFAIMLAITKHPKSDIACKAVVVGNNYAFIQTESVDDIIDGLQQVEAALHPALGLASFFKDYPIGKNSELIFIAANDVMKQAPLQDILQEYRAYFNYWIQTDNEGNIDLYKKVQNSKKHVQHLKLPLQELWSKPRQTNPPQKYSKEPASEVEFYPILFPFGAGDYKLTTSSDDGGEIYCFKDGYISKLDFVQYKNSARLDLIYPNNLPFKPDKMVVGSNGDMLCFNIQTKELAIVNVDTGDFVKTIFDKWSNKGYHFTGFMYGKDGFYFMFSRELWRITIQQEEVKVFPETASSMMNWFTNTYGHYQAKIEEKLKSVKQIVPVTVLKRIDSIAINQNNLLIINNKHQLTLTPYNVIKFEVRQSLVKIEATKKGDDLFRFPNGSSIKVHPLGMLILQQTPQSVYYQVVLHDAGADTNKIKLIGFLKPILGVDLKYCKRLIDTPNSILKSNCGKTEAEELKNELKKVSSGAKVSIVEQGNETIFIPTSLDTALGVATELDYAGNIIFQKNNQRTIEPKAFWDTQIKPFIQNIVEHGT